jgi:hypothetical protein
MNWIIDSKGVVNTVVSGKTYCFGTKQPHYNRMLNCLRNNNVEHFEMLFEIGSSVEAYCHGAVSVQNGKLYWDGNPMPSLFSERINDMRAQGCDFSPMMNFLENLSENPSDKSIVELFDFMQHKDLPLTPDGHFLAYKAVRNDFKDKYSGNFDNSVGNIVEVSRCDVNPDRNTHCGSGLHVGSIDYVLGYGNNCHKDDNGNVYTQNDGDQVIVCKVNPRDVVSVPTDSRYQKLRACRYEVVSILDRVFKQAVVGLASPIMAQKRTASPELIRKIGRVSKVLADAGLASV